MYIYIHFCLYFYLLGGCSPKIPHPHGPDPVTAPPCPGLAYHHLGRLHGVERGCDAARCPWNVVWIPMAIKTKNQSLEKTCLEKNGLVIFQNQCLEKNITIKTH